MLQRITFFVNDRPIHDVRRKPGLALLMLFVLGFCAVGSALAVGPQVPLARNGTAALPIKLVDPTGEVAKAFLMEPSLTDLRETLKQITGATFEQKTVESVSAGEQPAIYVGIAKHLEPLGVPQDLKLHEAYIRTTDDGSLILSGADSRGVSHAIYRLMFHLGARWYYPGEAWAVIPSQRELTVGFDLREQPDFPIQRRIWVGHGLRGAPRPAFDDWQRRNFVAQPFDVATSHTWVGLDTEKDFQSNPEWFAEVDGQRKASKPAYANPDVIQRGINHTLNFFANHPEAQMVSLSPPDGLGFDTGELAKKQAKVVETFPAHGTTFGRQADGTLVSLASENVFHFVNEVARAVQAKYPGKMVGILAYSAYAHPPSFDIEPNVYVELTRGYRRTPLSSVEQIQAFSQKAENLGIYEYYDVEQWSWERPGHARVSDLDYLQGSFQFYRQNNMRALSGEMSSNFGPYGVGYYVITRLLWDATQDARAVESEFYEQAFGPAADAIQSVYRRWESDRGLDDLALAATYRDLAEATRLTEGMPQYQERIDRIKMYAHFLKIYLQPKSHGTEEDDTKAWITQFGEEEARRRVDSLGDWVVRITDVHVVHGQAFNRYFNRRGELMGVDVSKWGEKGVPTHEEMAAIFQADLEDLKEVEVKPFAADVYSQRLVPVPTGAANTAGTKNAPAGRIDNVRNATVILKLDAGDAAELDVAEAGANYSISFLTGPDFESGMGGEFATPLSEGKTESKSMQVKAAEAGYYFVTISGNTLQRVSHPHAMLQNAMKIGNGRLYFFVPKGVRHFILQASAHQGATVKLTDPAGNVAVQQEGFAVLKSDVGESKLQAKWVIDVPQGADGAVWSIEGPGDVNATNRPILTGVPGYYALDPSLLLVPEETTKP